MGNTPLVADDLEFIAKKNGMKVMSAQLGGKRKNDAFNDMLKKHGLHRGTIIQDGSISCSIICPICENEGK